MLWRFSSLKQLPRSPEVELAPEIIVAMFMALREGLDFTGSPSFATPRPGPLGGVFACKGWHLQRPLTVSETLLLWNWPRTPSLFPAGPARATQSTSGVAASLSPHSLREPPKPLSSADSPSPFPPQTPTPPSLCLTSALLSASVLSPPPSSFFNLAAPLHLRPSPPFLSHGTPGVWELD